VGEAFLVELLIEETTNVTSLDAFLQVTNMPDRQRSAAIFMCFKLVLKLPHQSLLVHPSALSH